MLSRGSQLMRWVFVCLLTFAVGAMCQDKPAGASAAQSRSNDIRIHSGDLVQISVFGVPDLAQSVRVSGSGTVTMPLIGEVALEGKTASEAEGLLRDRLSSGQFVKNPNVTVFIKEYATQGASVLGEVEKPGVYPVLGDRRLYDLISSASGMTPKAGNTVTITHREHPTEPITVPISSDPSKSMDSNVEIYPGDTIVVSKAGVVYVVGEVGKPGGFVLDKGQNLTVLQALALAEGAKPTARLSQAKLIRRQAGGEPQEIPLQLGKIMQAKAKDLHLEPEDIVFVPASATKAAFRRGIDAAINTAVGVAIYRP